jgi:hypothetical protein
MQQDNFAEMWCVSFAFNIFSGQRGFTLLVTTSVNALSRNSKILLRCGACPLLVLSCQDSVVLLF